jgi:hypothetical protein
VSRLDYGKKYCHNSPTLDEEALKEAILSAINSTMSQKQCLIHRITGAMEMELAPIPGETMCLADIEQRLDQINLETRAILIEATHADPEEFKSRLKGLMDETAMLKEKRTTIEEQRKSNNAAIQQIENASYVLETVNSELTEWDETVIRQMVDTVKVMSADKIIVYLRGGIEIEQSLR